MILQRIKGVFSLTRDVLREIEEDESATGQAALIVLAVALLAGAGAAIGTVMGATAVQSLAELTGDANLPALMTPSFGALGAFFNAFLVTFISWIVWSLVTYVIGVNLFHGEATVGEMLRVIGYAQAPRLLSAFVFIPCLGPLLSLVGWVWAIVASFIAIQEGLDLDSGKSLVTILLSIVVVIIINAILIGPILNLVF